MMRAMHEARAEAWPVVGCAPRVWSEAFLHGHLGPSRCCPGAGHAGVALARLTVPCAGASHPRLSNVYTVMSRPIPLL